MDEGQQEKLKLQCENTKMKAEIESLN